MNKRGEFITITLILVALIGFVFFYEGATVAKKYVGDTYSRTAYNIQNGSQYCNLTEIQIARENLVFFDNETEFESKGFKLSKVCS